MESLVRFLIGSVLIYQLLPMANCKVIKQRDGHEKELKGNEVNYERSNGTTHFNSTLNGAQMELSETSIKYINATQLSSGSEFNINALTHVPENHQIDSSRSFSKWKRRIRRFLFAWTFYGPEFGLCSCLFKYAWHTYPIIPEVTVATLGRARRMISGFMYNFWEGYAEEQSNIHYRISNKVADMTAEDYYDYKSNQAYPQYGPFRRDGNYDKIAPENAPIVEKSNPQLVNVVEMLKNLQPKANVSDFVIRLARHIKSQPRKPHNVQQFRILNADGDEIRYFSKNHRHDKAKDDGNATKPAISEIKADVIAEGRSSVASNVGPISKPRVDRIGFDVLPPGLPPFSELPPADYTYYEGGTYHHVHDLRYEKGHYPKKKKRGSGGWLSFDFEDAILTALGLSHPGRSVKPSVVKCSKIYAFQVVIRFIQSAFGG